MGALWIEDSHAPMRHAYLYLRLATDDDGCNQTNTAIFQPFNVNLLYKYNTIDIL